MFCVPKFVIKAGSQDGGYTCGARVTTMGGFRGGKCRVVTPRGNVTMGMNTT